MKVVYSKRDRYIVEGLLVALNEEPSQEYVAQLLKEVQGEYRKQFAKEVKQLIQWYQS